MARVISVSVDARKALANITKMTKAVSALGLDVEMKRAATDTMREAIRKTPRRFTGQARLGWTMKRLGPSRYKVENRGQIMRFLDGGTKAHGPRKAQRLFVPLTFRAHKAGARGVLANKEKFKYGKDYVLARRVRGIKPHKIIAKSAEFGSKRALVRVNRFVKKHT